MHRLRSVKAQATLRDTDLALAESGVGEALAAVDLPFCDLNYEDVCWTANQGVRQQLTGTLSAQVGRGGRSNRFVTQVEVPPLGGCHGGDEEPLRRDTGHQVRLAQERAALQRHSGDRL